MTNNYPWLGAQNIRITEDHIEPEISDGLLSALAKCSSWSASSITMRNEDESTWRGLAEVSSKGEIEDLFIELNSWTVGCTDLRCPETLTKVWQATKKCHLTLINKFHTTQSAQKEIGDNGWARILMLIARKDEF